jgi:hypothetical protein
MCSHYLNALPGLRKCFLKEIFIPRHMLNTHSSHFVALHLNFLFAATYVFSSWHVLPPVLQRNGFCSGHAMLIVILHTLPQAFLIAS